MKTAIDILVLYHSVLHSDKHMEWAGGRAGAGKTDEGYFKKLAIF